MTSRAGLAGEESATETPQPAAPTRRQEREQSMSIPSHSLSTGSKVRIGHAATRNRQTYFCGKTGTLLRRNRYGVNSADPLWFVRIDGDQICASLDALFYASELEPA